MLDVLASATAGGALLAVLVWVLVRAIPQLSPRTRALLWWIAAAKFVIALWWTTPVPIKILPPPGPGADFVQSALPIDLNVTQATEAVPAATTRPDWAFLLVGSWAAGVIVSFSLGARRWGQRRQILRASLTANADVQRSARDIAALLGVRRCPQIRISPESNSPFIVGALRPVILVPAHFDALPAEQQRMSLCHELAHVKRRDLWLGIVPALAERIFFFHPFARIAAREYAFWREVACDAVVLETLETPPQMYGRLLLDLGVASRRATLAPAGAAWSFSSLKRRIVMLQRPSVPSAAAQAAAVIALLAATTAVAPFRIVARASTFSAIPSTQPAASEAMVPARSEPSRPVVPAARRERSSQDHQRPAARGRELRFVLLTGDNTTMSGSSDDIRRARRLRSSGEDLLWFEHDGKEYVIRDPDLLRDVRSAWVQVGEIGTQQGEIGARQGEIGVRQGAIGVRQGAIGMEQAAVGARQAKIGAEQAAVAARYSERLSRAQRDEIDRQMRSLDEEMRAMNEKMREFDAKMRELDAPMDELNKRMAELGADMEVLNAKMREATKKAEQEMSVFIERAIASGAAQIVR